MSAKSFQVFGVPTPLANWSAARSPAERRIVAAIVLVVVAALIWVGLWQPLVRDTSALRVAQSANATALLQAREMAKEIGVLARDSAPAAPSDARAGLERILVQQNLRGAATQVEWHDGRAHIVFAAVDYAALITALEAIQRDVRLRAVEATLTARIEPGTVRADVTLAR